MTVFEFIQKVADLYPEYPEIYNMELQAETAVVVGDGSERFHKIRVVQGVEVVDEKVFIWGREHE